MMGPCWWCSNQDANKTESHWYDSLNFYRYYNTCSCNMIMGCGAHGSVQNSYCPMYQHGYPTVYISIKTNRWGLTTYTAQCSQCSYYVSYSY